MKKFVSAAWLSAGVFTLACSEFLYSQPDNSQPDTSARITVAAVGDIMLGTNYPYHRLADDDGEHLLAGVIGILTSADLVIGNLEGVLTDKADAEKNCSSNSECFLFRSPAHYAKHLKNAGFSAVSLANNHAYDFGREGLADTMFNLAGAGITTSGIDGDIAIWPDRYIRTAMVAFSTYDYSHNLLKLEDASATVAKLAEYYDVVIVSFHAGSEGVSKDRLPFTTEYFHNENRGDVVKFAHMVIDAGADLVVGHGPHVPRAVELYNDRLIAYSLGNFSTFEGINIDGERGYAPILMATMNRDGALICAQIVSAIQTRQNGTQPDPKQHAYKKIRELTTLDLSGGGLRFLEDGSVYPAAMTESPC